MGTLGPLCVQVRVLLDVHNIHINTQNDAHVYSPEQARKDHRAQNRGYSDLNTVSKVLKILFIEPFQGSEVLAKHNVFDYHCCSCVCWLRPRSRRSHTLA